MNEAFDRRLAQLFADSPTGSDPEAFASAVMDRIRGRRRSRMIVRSLVAAALAAIAISASPLAVTSAKYIAEGAAVMIEPIGELIGTPAAFVLGIMFLLGTLTGLRSK